MEIQTDIYMYTSQSRDRKSGIFCRYLYFFELLSIVEPFYLNKWIFGRVQLFLGSGQKMRNNSTNENLKIIPRLACRIG